MRKLGVIFILFSIASAAGWWLWPTVESKSKNIQINHEPTRTQSSIAIADIPKADIPKIANTGPTKVKDSLPTVNKKIDETVQQEIPVTATAQMSSQSSSTEKSISAENSFKTDSSDSATESSNVVAPPAAVRPLSLPAVPSILPLDIKNEQPIQIPMEELNSQPALTPIAPPPASTTPAPSLKHKSQKPIWDYIRHFWVWLGVGSSYQSHQNSLEIAQRYSFNNIQAPMLHFNSGWIGESWGLDIYYRQNPGLVKRAANIDVVNGQYTWKTMGADAIYRYNDSDWMLQLGMRLETLPFTAADTSLGSIVLKDHSLQLASLGFETRKPLAEKLIVQYNFRYLHPMGSEISDSTSHSLKNFWGLAGSVEGIHYLKDNLFLSTGLRLEWYEYKYSYASTNVTSHEGTIRQILSNIEFKIGYEW